jgi:UDP-sugar pyrophosphorylase
LDALLKSNSLISQGDVNDPISNISIYPGNVNQLLFKLQPYMNTLDKFQGQVVSEFVDPKYTDATRSEFKSPARLECMMQDYPKILLDASPSRVGFICFPSWICFSTCKNNYIDAVAYNNKGIPPACASRSESDHYYCQAEMLRRIGIAIPIGDIREFNSIPVNVGPRICIDPSKYIFPRDYLLVFPYPNKVKISKKSTLIITGNVEIHSLMLDGAIHFEAISGTKLTVNNENVIRNEGFIIEDIDSSDDHNNTIYERMRGYKINKVHQEFISTKYIHHQYNLTIDTINNTIAEYYYIGNTIKTSIELENVN